MLKPGKEVAKFCQSRFCSVITNLPEYKEGRYVEALRRSFHRMDELLEDVEYEPILESFRRIPNPSDKDRRTNPANPSPKEGKEKELIGFRALPPALAVTAPAAAALTQPSKNAPEISTHNAVGPSNSSTAMETDPDHSGSGLLLSTQQAMEMLQQLVVKDGSANRMESSAPIPAPVAGEGKSGPSPASTPSLSVASVPVAAVNSDRPMVCALKDHR